MKKTSYTLALLLLTSLGFSQGFSEIQKVVAGDRESEDRLGWGLDINGDYAFVGAYADDFGAVNPNMGSVYIYERSGDTWTFVQKIFNEDQDDYDRFGWSVAVDGDMAVIGAYGEDEDENDENSLSKAGSAYIFQRSGDGTWEQIQKIVASDRSAGDEFGFSVAIHDGTIVIGAHYCSTNTLGGGYSLHAGAAYIFEENDMGEWIESAKVVASDRFGNPGIDYEEEDWNWRFGESVAVWGDFVLVGSPFASKAYAFEPTGGGGAWVETDQLTYPGISWLDRAGIVSIDGSKAVLGAQTWDYSETWGEDDLMNAGGAAIYTRSAGGSWDFEQMIVASDRSAGDHFGISVSIEGDYIVSGAHQDNHDEDTEDDLENAGSAYIFKFTDGTWSEYDKIDASDREIEDELGIAVSVTGTTALVGAFQQDYAVGGGDYIEDAGAAYFYMDDDDIACPTVFSSQSPTICEGDDFTVGTSTYTETGTYEDILTSVDGCDSVVTTNLTVIGSDPFEYESTICEGQSVIVGDSEYTEAGVYTDIFTSTAGCDSIVETTVIVTPGIDGNDVSEDEFGNLFTSAFDITLEYQWITCDPYEEIPGATGPFLFSPADGQYACIAISDDGCVDTSDCFTVGDEPGGDDELTIPGTGVGPIQTDCEGTLYDSGGSTGEYSINEDGQITIMPTGATSVELTIVEFDVEGSFSGCDFDYMEIYDGENTSAELIGTYCNTSPPPGTISSTGPAITILFHSDDAFTMEGFEIDWECVMGSDGSGIDEELLNNINVFPNPNSGTFSIDLTGITETVRAEIMNELGQVIYRESLNQNNNLVELNNISSGTYILRLSTDDTQVYKQVIINQ